MASGSGGIRELQALGQHDELRADGVGREPGHDERLAALAGGDQAVGRDRGRDVVVGEEDGQAGDVAVGAVGVAGPDGHLLGRALAVEHAGLGIEVDADDLGQLGDVVVRDAGLDPADGASGRARSPARTACRRCAGRRRSAFSSSVLSDGNGQVDPPADHLAGEPEVVALGVEAEERDPEAVLAARRAVAAAGVAAGPHEDRHHVEPEADAAAATLAWATLTGTVDRLAAEGDGQRRRAVGRGVEGRARRASRAPGLASVIAASASRRG